jgi:hypothetical protein
MANAGWIHTYSFEDAKGQIGTVTLYSNHALEADALSASETLRSDISAMTGMAFRQHTLTRVVATGTTAPQASSDREEKGSFNFTDADGRAVVISIPGFLESQVIAGTKNVDLTALTVANFISDLTGEDFTNARAIDIVAIKSAVEKFTASNNKR